MCQGNARMDESWSIEAGKSRGMPGECIGMWTNCHGNAWVCMGLGAKCQRNAGE